MFFEIIKRGVFMKKITLDNIRAKVRTVVFNASAVSYVLAHEAGDELADGRLEELYAEWKEQTNSSTDEEEGGEQFIEWLETEKGFVALPVVDEPYEFAG
jgi:hypothetical protein